MSAPSIDPRLLALLEPLDGQVQGHAVTLQAWGRLQGPPVLEERLRALDPRMPRHNAPVLFMGATNVTPLHRTPLDAFHPLAKDLLAMLDRQAELVDVIEPALADLFSADERRAQAYFERLWSWWRGPEALVVDAPHAPRVRIETGLPGSSPEQAMVLTVGPLRLWARHHADGAVQLVRSMEAFQVVRPALEKLESHLRRAPKRA